VDVFFLGGTETNIYLQGTAALWPLSYLRNAMQVMRVSHFSKYIAACQVTIRSLSPDRVLLLRHNFTSGWIFSESKLRGFLFADLVASNANNKSNNNAAE
jgi:hypothetical protein